MATQLLSQRMRRSQRMATNGEMELLTFVCWVSRSNPQYTNQNGEILRIGWLDLQLILLSYIFKFWDNLQKVLTPNWWLKSWISLHIHCSNKSMTWHFLEPTYCWWTKSCTSWYIVYPIIYKVYVSQVVSRISSINSMSENSMRMKEIFGGLHRSQQPPVAAARVLGYHGWTNQPQYASSWWLNQPVWKNRQIGSSPHPR